jgi:hypothetical protein
MLIVLIAWCHLKSPDHHLFLGYLTMLFQLLDPQLGYFAEP